jgi:photosystem II stability/assembly factor-like uncharacterized protein
MSSPWLARTPRWAKFAAAPMVALLIGISVVIASSPASLTRDHRAIKSTPPAQPSGAVIASPPPTVTDAGILGAAPRLLANGSSNLIGATTNLDVGSIDGGRTWSTSTPPSNGVGIVGDPSNPLHAITGGSTVRVTSDGGSSWQRAGKAPPGSGPYQVLAISPFDPSVWFFVHDGKLLRTRDASNSWRELATLPVLANPVLARGHVVGEFFLATGARVFELIDNGQQVIEKPPLPSGVTAVDLTAVGGDQLPLLARGANNTLYVLKGSAWSAMNGVLAGPIAGGLNAILVGNGGAKLAAGSISYTFDGGATWRHAVGLPPDQSVEAIAGQPTSTTFFAYCYGGDIYTSSDGGGTWTAVGRALRSRTG